MIQHPSFIELSISEVNYESGHTQSEPIAAEPPAFLTTSYQMFAARLLYLTSHCERNITYKTLLGKDEERENSGFNDS